MTTTDWRLFLDLTLVGFAYGFIFHNSILLSTPPSLIFKLRVSVLMGIFFWIAVPLDHKLARFGQFAVFLLFVFFGDMLRGVCRMGWRKFILRLKVAAKHERPE